MISNDFVEVSVKELSKKVSGIPVKHNGKIVGKVIGLDYTEGCKHEGAKMDITVELTNKKLKDGFWRVRFV